MRSRPDPGSLGPLHRRELAGLLRERPWHAVAHVPRAVDGSSGKVHDVRQGRTKRGGDAPERQGRPDVPALPVQLIHLLPDHAIVFRILSISPTQGQVTTRRVMRMDAVKGVDDDVKSRPRGWLATTRIARWSRKTSAASCRLRAPILSAGQESGAIRLTDWYCGMMASGLRMQRAAEQRRYTISSSPPRSLSISANIRRSPRRSKPVGC